MEAARTGIDGSRHSAFADRSMLMRILGWLLVVGLIPMVFIYPPGFMWGAQPEGFPNVGPAHASSPYDGLHPYLYMLGALYVAYGILLIRGAKTLVATLPCSISASCPACCTVL